MAELENALQVLLARETARLDRDSGSFCSHAELRAWTGGFRIARFTTLRVLAVLMMVELSGLAHLAFDMYDLVSGADHHGAHDDCEDEGSGHECPPGCLNCHCAHAAVVIAAPRLERSCEAVVVEPAPVAFRPSAHTYPSCAYLGSIYRPPRFAA